jgi:hypothetical protein
MHSLLKTNTCGERVHPFACVFQEEEPWSAHGVVGMSTRLQLLAHPPEKVHYSGTVEPIKHPLDVMEADGRSKAHRICSRCRADLHISRSGSSKSSKLSSSIYAEEIHDVSISFTPWTTLLVLQSAHVAQGPHVSHV